MTGTQHPVLSQYLELQIRWTDLDHETKLGLLVLLLQLHVVPGQSVCDRDDFFAASICR
jgi:hypothetical protein